MGGQQRKIVLTEGIIIINTPLFFSNIIVV